MFKIGLCNKCNLANNFDQEREHIFAQADYMANNRTDQYLKTISFLMAENNALHMMIDKLNQTLKQRSE